MTSKIAVRDAGADQLPDTDRDRVTTALSDARAANTRTAYAKHWRYFTAWCVQRSDVDHALSATPAVVAAFLADRATTQRTASIKLAAAAIRSAYRTARLPDPTKTPIVRDTIRGIARQHARHPDAAPRQAKALEYATAIRLLATAEQPRPRGRGHENPATTRARAAGDKAIVSLLFCAGLRRARRRPFTWSDIETPTHRPAPCGSACGRPNQPRRLRQDHRLLVDPFAKQSGPPRHPPDPQPSDSRHRPVPGPHLQATRRPRPPRRNPRPLRPLRSPRARHRTHPPRCQHDRRPSRRWMETTRHGQPLCLARPHRGRRRRKVPRVEKNRPQGCTPRASIPNPCRNLKLTNRRQDLRLERRRPPAPAAGPDDLHGLPALPVEHPATVTVG